MSDLEPQPGAVQLDSVLARTSLADGVRISQRALWQPVTGAAHCVLGPFWAGRLKRDELLGYQASARGGVVRVAPGGDRVRLSGRAVTVLKGELV